MSDLAGISRITSDEWDLLATRLAAGAQEQIDDASRFWKGVIDSLPAHLAILDGDGTIIAVNETWRRFGRDNGGGEIGVGWNYLDVCAAAAAAGDASAAGAAAVIRSVLSGRQETAVKLYACDGPGLRRWFLMRVAPLRSGSGGRVVIQHHDVTQHQEASLEARLHSRLLNSVDAAVIALGPQREIIFWNDAATRIYGWTPDEVMGSQLRDHVEVDEAYRVAAAALAQTGA